VPGAAPAVPNPFRAAPTIPATWVPWPPSSTSAGSVHDPSGSSAYSPSISGMSVVKFRLSAALKLGARSGWLASIPVSMIPTSTSWVPGWTAYEPVAVASIMSLPHCRWARGSASTAARMRPLEGRTAPPRSMANLSGIFFLGACPMETSWAAPFSASWARTSAAKLRFPDSTVATPIAVFSRTMVPPAASTAARAAARLAPYRTRYRFTPSSESVLAWPCGSPARPRPTSARTRTTDHLRTPTSLPTGSIPWTAEPLLAGLPPGDPRDSRRPRSPCSPGVRP
jgi:hypothetical protein